MLNKIFNKITALLIAVVIIFLMATYFVIFPKITNYFYAAEYKNIQNQLDYLDNVVSVEATNLKSAYVLATENYKNDIVRITNTSYDILESYYTDYKLGIYSKKEAIEHAFKTISKIKYGHVDDYIFILDKKGTYFYHPNPTLLEANMYYMTDVRGKYVTQDIIKSVEQTGEGFSSYMWPKANESTSYEKLTFSKYFEPFGLIIAAGIYVNNIEKEISLQKQLAKNNFKDIFSKSKVLEDGFYYVVNKAEVLVNQKRYLKTHKVFDKSRLHQIKKALATNKGFSTSFDGVKSLSWVKYNAYFDWYIVATVNENELFVKSKELNQMILQIIILILIFMLFIGLYIANKIIVQPINILTDNALKIKDGDFSLRNEITSNDEIGILSKQFNFMLDNIEDNIKNLELKVNLRTEELRHKLLYDELTGLKNRYSFLEHVKGERFATVILVDINDFDDINELYGYRVGNEVLTKFGYYLQKLSEKNSSEAYRIYGNAYAILYLNELFNFDNFEAFIHTIVNNIKKEPIYINELSLDIYLDITLGIAICQDQPLKKANIALRKAKKSDRNYIVYNNEIDTKRMIENTIYWRNKIKDAITFDYIVPFFQPIVNQKGEIIKYETLMRMEDIKEEEICYITPDKFLEISVRTKQYISISSLVISKALDSLGKTNKDISINLSFLDINDVNFLNFLENKFSLIKNEDYSRIVFEILESDSIANYDILREFIIKYRKLGVRIAIDDFGSGYSNFSHIMEIRPDFLKIDSSLVKNIHKDKDSFELVKSIVVFSNAMDMKTIAEFVHCQEVYEILLKLGVNEFQGYYFGAPQKEL